MATSNYEEKTGNKANSISTSTGSFNSVKGIHNSRIDVGKLAQATTSKTYYVSATGNDSNNGLTTTTAFRTLQRAANSVSAPGDTVYVMNGTYTRTDSPKEILVIWHKHGTPTAPITFKAYPGHKPVIKSQNSFAINIAGSSYVIIEGLELIGNNDKITLQYALQQKNNLNNPLTSGIGIAVNPSFLGGVIKNHSHHIVIRNNKISKFGGTAIGSFKADYITIENNVLFQNCLYSPWGTSAISMLFNWNSDNNTTDYKMIVRGNVSHNNQNFIPYYYAGKITEGHGIMIDDALNKGTNSTHQAYWGKTLVANNIVYKNGASGIHVFRSANIDVINNTTYQNAQNPNTQHLGEIATVTAERVKVFNNIMYAKKDGIVNTLYQSQNTVTYDRNLVYNSSKYTSSGLSNILGKDPQFVDPAKSNFSLKYGSLAIDAGLSNYNGAKAPNIDQRGVNRPQDGDGNGIAIVDIGALERTP
ncbi:MAG: choice-of-anchor Q domain-containing protein [Nostoc sp. CreGUA01]|nr:choice-of-anchor Q domain-containing protein [Nostoc sp. CreGUA01]